MRPGLAGPAALVVVRAWAGREPGQMAPELHGEWAAADARFADRSSDTGADHVAFHTGGSQRSERERLGTEEVR